MRLLAPLLVALAALALAWAARRGAPDAQLAAAREALRELTASNEALAEQNERLRLTAAALPADPRLVEKYAAERLDMLLPDERVYVFPPDFGLDEDPADPRTQSAPVVLSP